MSSTCGSANYIWNTNSKSMLGKGSSGKVFPGRSRHNGEPVAVKTFKPQSECQARSLELQLREFEVLKKVNHENIVKLLAIEEQQHGKGKVIVMELCSGKSLFNVIDDPENAYGLQEDEFLLVLKHLSAGMKHLRDNNLVHRDLKPGNIMKFIADDGSTVYKLVDFGSARELYDDEKFISFHGTEEYVHPDIYEHAVLHKRVGKSFSANVDLWSIGVTLYQVATGNLPFRPYGGRRNKEIMYYITSKKASGVIAGTQLEENGAIEWSRDLPRTCHLSAGLAALVTPLLGGLLEVDPHKMWTFDKFFNEVTAVLSRKAVCIFYVNKLAPLLVYTHNSDGFHELQRLVLEQTGLAPDDQVHLFHESALREDSPIPETTPSDPIVLFDWENNNILLETPNTGMPDAPEFRTLPQDTSAEDDANLARCTCSAAHVHKRRMERLATATALVARSQHTLVQVVTTLLHQVYAESQQEQRVTYCLGQHLQTLLACQKTSAALPVLTKGVLYGQFCSALEKCQIEFEELNQQLSTLAHKVSQLHQKYISVQVLTTDWESARTAIPDISSSPRKAATFIAKVGDFWKQLCYCVLNSLALRDDLHHYKLDKKMLAKACGDLRTLGSECQAATNQLAEVFANWYKMAKEVFLQVERLKTNISTCGACVMKFKSSLDDVQDKYKKAAGKLQENLDTTRVSSSNDEVQVCRDNCNDKGTKSYHGSLQELSEQHREFRNVVNENTELVRNYRERVLTLEPEVELTAVKET